MEVDRSDKARILKVVSETGSLRKVLIHRPDKGIERVTPENAIELLYEDIVFLDKMIAEHDEFTTVLRYFLGKENVLEVEDLLTQVLKNAEAKRSIINDLNITNQASSATLKIFESLDECTLSKILITGTHPKTEDQFFNPLPNLIFTRDIGVMINEHLLVPKAAKSARKRESVICKCIYKYHPEFQHISSSGKLIIPSESNEEITIEGGDIMMLDKDHLLVGSSERTSERAVDDFINYVLKNKVVKMVTRMALPKLRFCMHLDTIFTRFDKNMYVGFSPLIMQKGAMPVIHATLEKEITYHSLEICLKEIYPESKIIPCGNDKSPYAEREQWTDACNLFAVKDGVAFSYDRNYYTNKALQENGYRLVSAAEIIQEFKEGKTSPQDVEKTIITIQSSELSRARGGPHCLTFPLLRD